jgi:hypothetical protein
MVGLILKKLQDGQIYNNQNGQHLQGSNSRSSYGHQQNYLHVDSRTNSIGHTYHIDPR